jgi:hypothetical protein
MNVAFARENSKFRFQILVVHSLGFDFSFWRHTMYKALTGLALLITTFVVISGANPSDVPHSPVVVANLALKGQTAAIPITTLFTPKVTAMYRISTYMVMTTPATTNGLWALNLGWTDDAGVEGPQQISAIDDTATPPNAYAFPPVQNTVQTVIIRALAGTPVTYSVSIPGESAGGTYEVFTTVEGLP